MVKFSSISSTSIGFWTQQQPISDNFINKLSTYKVFKKKKINVYQKWSWDITSWSSSLKFITDKFLFFLNQLFKSTEELRFVLTVFRCVLHLLWNLAHWVVVLDFQVLFQQEYRRVNAWIFSKESTRFRWHLNPVVIGYQRADCWLVKNLWNPKIVYKIFSSTNNHMLIDFICGNNFAISSRNAIICTNKCILNQLNHECFEVFFPVLIISCDLYCNLLAFISNISLNKK